MKLSIVVPVYNVELYLEECLDSLVSQTLDEYEVIVVNDGSTDNSQNIIDKYVRNYPSIFRSLTKNNGGLGDARNFAIPFCRGQYITFLDSDDYVEKNAYEELYNLASANKYDILMYDFEWFWENGRKEHRSSLPSGYANDVFNKETYILSNPAACNKIFKTSIFRDNDIRFPVKMWYEDIAIIPSLVQYADKIGYVNKAYYKYRQHDESIMHAEYSHRLLEIIDAMNNLESNFIDNSYYAEREFLYFYQLCYYASFRFIIYHKYEDIKICMSALYERYPNWSNNKYYKNKSMLFKLYCFLLKHNLFKTAWILSYIRERLR